MGKKEQFIGNLKAAGGIIYVACENTGINRSTYYLWRKTDPEFAQMVDEVMEAQVDYVESKLMKLIEAGDTTATIFYLKTKGKKRGYTEKPQPAQQEEPASDTTLMLPEDKDEEKRLAKKVKNKKDYIVKVLKKQGKYTAELSMQVNIAARLLVRYDMLTGEIFAGGHQAVKVEQSREGNKRESISPKEKLFLDISQQCQKALQALGMNTDAKERKTENDNFNEFMNAFKNDGDE